MLVFPEGTFFRPPELLPFRLGAFKAAVDTERPIVPIALRGTRSVLPDGTWLFRRAPIDVTISAPLVPAGAGVAGDGPAARRDATHHRHGCGEPVRATKRL